METTIPGKSADEATPDAGAAASFRPGLTRSGLVLVAVHALAFCGLSWLPTPAVPIWGAFLRGSELWHTRSFPVTETVAPLARGMPFVQTGWGSDLFVFLAGLGGFPGLKLLFSGAVLAASAAVCALVHRTGIRSGAMVAVPLCLFALVASSTGIYDSICLGMLGLAAAELAMTGRSRLRLIAVPVIFGLWANLHASFLVGLVWLFSKAAAEWRTESDCTTHDCRSANCNLLLTLELSLAATFVTPYGPWLYPAAWEQLFGGRFEQIGYGGPLSIRMLSGFLCLGLMLLTFLCTLRQGRNAARSRLFPLIALGLVAAWNERFVPLWGVLLSAGVAESLGLWQSDCGILRPEESPVATRTDRSQKLNLVIAAVFVWISFSFSAVGAAWLSSGKPVDPQSQVAGNVPLGAAQYLREHPPRTLIFHPANWGDYLLLFGSPDLQVFTTTEVDRLPESVWVEYRAIAAGQGGADGLLDRYGIDTVVLDLRTGNALAEVLRGARVWEPVYRDDRSAIYVRRTNTP
jgi:hypothetical protein